MQSNTAVIEAPGGDKQLINEIFGGLSLVPYGIFLLVSAYAFNEGWLNWETNGGPPYLGGILAWIIDRRIRWAYRKKHNFVFDMDKPQDERAEVSRTKAILVILGLLGLLVTWYLDASFHFSIRFMPLWFGVFVCLRGIDWLQKEWTGYGLNHILLGSVPIGLSVTPMLFGVAADHQYFGLEGVYELAAMGIVLIIMSIMEHLIFLKIRGSDFD